MINIFILIIIMIFAMFFIPRFVCFYFEQKEFKNISTENLYKIWRETDVKTDICFKAYKELNKRGYWDGIEKKKEQEAIKIFNKYKYDK